MKPKKLAIILAIIGPITIFAGFMIREQDMGSCPANSTGCYRTFSGTNVYITPVANGVIDAGAIILGLSLLIWFAKFFHKARNQSKTPKTG